MRLRRSRSLLMAQWVVEVALLAAEARWPDDRARTTPTRNRGGDRHRAGPGRPTTCSITSPRLMAPATFGSRFRPIRAAEQAIDAVQDAVGVGAGVEGHQLAQP